MTNEIQVVKTNNTLKQWMQDDNFQHEIARTAGRHFNADRMARIATNAMLRTPKLMECDQTSFLRCMLDLAQWRLEPDGRHAHLIPFRNRKLNITECQLIVDYKGLVQLVLRSGAVVDVKAMVVYEGDHFVMNMGDVLEHTAYWYNGKPKGKMIAAYVRVKHKNGGTTFEVMPRSEIDSVRNRSKAKDSGPWVTDFDEMAKKTVFRRATKWLPISAEVVEVLDRDFDTFESIEPDPMDTGQARQAPATLDDLIKDMTPARPVASEKGSDAPGAVLTPDKPKVAQSDPEPAKGSPPSHHELRLSNLADCTHWDEANRLLDEYGNTEGVTDLQYEEYFKVVESKKPVVAAK